MFLSEADRRRSPFGPRNPGVILGSLILAAAATAPIGAKAIPFALSGVLLGHAGVAFARGRWADREFHFGWPEFALAAFFAWAAVTSVWSLDTARALTSIGLGLAIVFGSAAAAKGMADEERGAAARMAEGLWLGFALALVYFLIELLTNQGLKIWAYNLVGLQPGDLKAGWFEFSDGRLVAIDRVDLTRNAAPVSLLLWPSLMAVLGAAAASWRRPLVAGLAALAAVVVFLSPHETSKLALPLGALAFLACRVSPAWTWRGLAALWVMGSLLIVPAALLAHRLGLHDAPWLQQSAQHRIVIWNYTAEKTLEAPLFGAGALTTYVTGQFIKPKVENLPGEHQPRTLSQHAHNVFLQTWYELGLTGALLLAAAGAAIIGGLRRLPPRTQPFAAATFASAMALAGASYGMWQAWYMAMWGLAAIAFAVGARAYETREEAVAGGVSGPPCEEVRKKLQA